MIARPKNAQCVRWLAAAMAGAAAMAAAFTGCMSGAASVTADVSPEGWSEPVEMFYKNHDTLTVRQLSLTLRHSAEVWPSENRLRFERRSPSGTVRIDTLSVVFAPVTSHAGRLHETTVTLPNEAAEAAEAGATDWRFTVAPLGEIRGVWSVGVAIVK